MYWSDWGHNHQYHARWKLHPYFDLDIKTDKEINKAIRFDVWMQNFAGDLSNNVSKYLVEADHPYICPCGQFKVLCMDYTHPKSLEFAYKYANKFKTECNRMIIFVVTRSSGIDHGHESQGIKEYFGWNDCMRLAQKYDASLIEMSTDYNSCLFVYDEILIEYIYTFCV